MDPAAAWSRLPCRTLGGRIPRQFNSDLSFTTSLCRANYSLYVEAHMRTQAGLHIDPGALAAGPGARELEVVVPYTEWALAEATLQRAAVLAAGLNVSSSDLGCTSIRERSQRDRAHANWKSSCRTRNGRWPRRRCSGPRCWRRGSMSAPDR